MKISTGFLGKTVTLQIDRPIGSRHPKHGFVYPINYGFVPGTFGADGEELDAYVLGCSVPVQSFTGRCIAVICRLNECDDKLVVAPAEIEFSDNQIREATHFQEQFFVSTLHRAEPM